MGHPRETALDFVEMSTSIYTTPEALVCRNLEFSTLLNWSESCQVKTYTSEAEPCKNNSSQLFLRGNKGKSRLEYIELGIFRRFFKSVGGIWTASDSQGREVA